MIKLLERLYIDIKFLIGLDRVFKIKIKVKICWNGNPYSIINYSAPSFWWWLIIIFHVAKFTWSKFFTDFMQVVNSKLDKIKKYICLPPCLSKQSGKKLDVKKIIKKMQKLVTAYLSADQISLSRLGFNCTLNDRINRIKYILILSRSMHERMINLR